MRESAATLASAHSPAPGDGAPKAGGGAAVAATASDWGVPPFEPLSIRTADFDEVQILDLPMSAHAADVREEELPTASAGTAPGPSFAPSPRSAPLPESAPLTEPPASSADAASAVGAAEPAAPAATGTEQRILTVRVCALGEAQWSGVELMTALDSHGLAHGRYQVFHRKHSDGRTLFCAASLVEPGTFELARMPTEFYRGLTLFAVLPGPADPVQTIDALIEAARGLAQTLHGSLQDAKGVPLSGEQIEALREDAARSS